MSWSVQGRTKYVLFACMMAVVFLAPVPLDFNYLTDASRIFNRFVGCMVGLVLLELLGRVRRLMDGLETANQHLETRVAARTVDLQHANQALQLEIAERRQAQIQQQATQQQLLQSQKQEVMGQFAGGVAHDFNNMLTVILGYTSLLLDPKNPGVDLRSSLLAIKQAGERAADLTRQLLIFSRHNVIQSKVVPLNDLIRETEAMLRPLIPESIDLVLELSPQLPRVTIDPAQFSHVLVNLALNARDAMPTGGRLTIRTRCLDEADSSSLPRLRQTAELGDVLLEVTDTGCGMTPQVRERIFDPFFSTKAPGKGAGLGLSIVDNIVRQSGGTIDVVTALNQGTSIQIHLPSTGEKATLNEKDESFPGRAGNETILLVEDEDQLRDLAATVLRNAGYDVVEASHGAEAFEKAEKLAREIDLLVTDVVMPGMSGRQLGDRLRWCRPGLKVLYMSGYNNDAMVVFGIEHETVQFLAKPFTPTQLAQKVQQVLMRDSLTALNSSRAADNGSVKAA